MFLLSCWSYFASDCRPTMPYCIFSGDLITVHDMHMSICVVHGQVAKWSSSQWRIQNLHGSSRFSFLQSPFFFSLFIPRLVPRPLLIFPSSSWGRGAWAPRPHVGFTLLLGITLAINFFLMWFCWRKNQHTGIRGQVFAKSQKVNQACQSIWPEINKGENKVKFESVSAGILNISQMGVSASFADTIDDKNILNASA